MDTQLTSNEINVARSLLSNYATAHGLPLDPTIATVIVLSVLKIGLSIFCDYTEPPAGNSGTLPPAN